MVTVLHTSDWHVGKTIRGNSRADEHRAVLSEITTLASEHSVDVVLVAGDLFETTSPSPEAELIVYDALLGLAKTGAAVAVIAGNHDNPRKLRAVAPLLELGQIHVLSEPAAPGDGGTQRLRGPNGELDVGLLPFISQRGIIKADQLMADAEFEHAQEYAHRLGRMVNKICDGISGDVPSVLMQHGFVVGGEVGGGERAAHLEAEYAIKAQAFPATVQYVALGHLHRAQKIAGATAIHYCGSPLQLDFGETSDTKQVNVVDLEHGKPAKVTELLLTEGTPLVTLTGTVGEIAAAADDLHGDCWIRARVTEPRRVSLADELRAAVGDRGHWVVQIDLTQHHEPARKARVEARAGKTPPELYRDYLKERNVDDDRLIDLFKGLHDDVTGLAS